MKFGEQDDAIDLPNAVAPPTDEECALIAILLDRSGLELAEFCWVDETKRPGRADHDICYRAYPYQWPWWRDRSPLSVDQGARSTGKALDLDTMVPTPSGWTTMGDLRVGSIIYDMHGRQTVVTEAFAVQEGRPCYEVQLGNGERIVADEDHLWVTTGGTVTTAELNGRKIPTARPLHRDNPGLMKYPVGFYTLGAWLGDGSSYRAHITCFDQGILDQIAAEGYDVRPLTTPGAYAIRLPDQTATKSSSVTHLLTEAGLIKNRCGQKHIPMRYLRAGTNQRRALLQGLMDTDGTIDKRNGRCEITLTSERLARDTFELIASLGQRPSWTESEAKLDGRVIGPKYRVGFQPNTLVPFRLDRKIVHVRANRRMIRQHAVTSVTPVESRPVRCIKVDSPTSTFLVGRSMIPTHNSESIMAQACAFPWNFPGQEFLLTAPEGPHVDAITDRIENRIMAVRLLREMLVTGGGRRGITHHPFQAHFAGGAKVFSRLPQKTGLGIKGCMTADAMVLTREHGIISIAEVAVGDHTWTHRNRWLPVTKVESFEADVVEVRGPGSAPVRVTGHHQFYGADDESAQPGKTKRKLGGLHWTRADSLVGQDRIGFFWSGPGDGAWDSDTSTPDIPFGDRPEFWWLVGRWIADGHASNQQLKSGGQGRRRSHWCVTPAQHRAVTSRLEALGLHYRFHERTHSTAGMVEHCGNDLSLWLTENCGRRAENKRLPDCAWQLPRHLREQLLDGYLSGDGTDAERPSGAHDRITAGSASRQLAIGIGIIGQGLGRCTSYGAVQPKQTHVMGVELKKPPMMSYKVSVSHPGHGRGIHRDGYALYKIRTAAPAGRATVYNIINDDHSYLANGIFQHNTHPAVMHVDEGQDISAATWKEMPEVVRFDLEGARWCVHGVSKGIRDDFFWDITQPESGWTVHRPTALHRPDWNEEERARRIKNYGSEHSPDFKRNVYGMHGDAMNRIFMLQQLNACRDDQQGSVYNTEEYARIIVYSDEVAARANERSGKDHDVQVFDDVQLAELINMVEVPASHLALIRPEQGKPRLPWWFGMDFGLVGDPTEILGFVEYTPGAEERKANRRAQIAVPDAGLTRFKLMVRIQLNGVEPELQARLILWLLDTYGPQVFAMDATGNGYPVFRSLQRLAGHRSEYLVEEITAATRPDLTQAQRDTRKKITRIKGYNFSEKIPIEIDWGKVEELKLTKPADILAKATVRRWAKDAGTDILRGLVAQRRLLLPYDTDIYNQWNGQTWRSGAEPVDAWGNRRATYLLGVFHCLDAGRMFAVGQHMVPMDDLIAETRKPKPSRIDHFGL